MLRDELDDMKRIAERNAKIEKLLAAAEDGSEGEPADADEPKEQPKANLVAIDQTTDGTIIYRKLRPWESIDARGRVFQHRPMTSTEFEAEETRAFLKKQFKADQAHAAKVAEAIKEAAREQERLDKKREHERVTGRRPMKDTISLAEAERRGLIGSGGRGDEIPAGWYGVFASGGQYVKGN